MNRTLITAAAATMLSLAGCSTNVAAVKSDEGKPTLALTGPAASVGMKSLATAAGGPAAGKVDDRLEAVALFPGPEQPVGIAVSKAGRTFLSFPRWADPVKYTVVELKDGKTTPFPNADVNTFDGTDLKRTPPATHFVSVQAIVFDDQDRLWVLDPGSFNFAPNILGAPKLLAYDIDTGKQLKAIAFPNDVALKTTYLNDVRIDLKRGKEGTAYITDSGKGGIITVDLATGQSWRHLTGDPSVLPEPGLAQQSEGKPLLVYKSSGEVSGPDFRSDGVALSPDAKTLYYTTVASRNVYAISTNLLNERDPAKEQQVIAGVKRVATKPSGNDGIVCDAAGIIYTTDFEDGAIRQVNPSTGEAKVLVQDARPLWPDTLALHGNYLYVTSNQLARQPNFHGGKDLRQPPYGLWRIRLEGNAKVASYN